MTRVEIKLHSVVRISNKYRHPMRHGQEVVVLGFSPYGTYVSVSVGTGGVYTWAKPEELEPVS